MKNLHISMQSACVSDKNMNNHRFRTKWYEHFPYTFFYAWNYVSYVHASIIIHFTENYIYLSSTQKQYSTEKPREWLSSLHIFLHMNYLPIKIHAKEIIISNYMVDLNGAKWESKLINRFNRLIISRKIYFGQCNQCRFASRFVNCEIKNAVKTAQISLIKNLRTFKWLNVNDRNQFLLWFLLLIQF